MLSTSHPLVAFFLDLALQLNCPKTIKKNKIKIKTPNWTVRVQDIRNYARGYTFRGEIQRYLILSAYGLFHANLIVSGAARETNFHERCRLGCKSQAQVEKMSNPLWIFDLDSGFRFLTYHVHSAIRHWLDYSNQSC